MRNQGEEAVLSVRGQQECVELYPGMDDEPGKGIWVGRQSNVGNRSCVSPTDPWIGKQNMKLPSDSWKKGPVCSRGLPRRP